MKTQIAYIALGSNLGDREKTLRDALQLIPSTGTTRVLKVSGFLENPAIGGPADSPAFVNAAAELETELSADGLLNHLLQIEQQLGRQRREKWGPRTIDLDLLLFGQEIIERPGLIVPHPLMHSRRFVLEPMMEIAPEVMHPILKKSVAQLREDTKSIH